MTYECDRLPSSLGRLHERLASRLARVVIPTPLHLALVLLASLLDDRQRRAIAYLRAENRVLREQLGDRRRSPPRSSTDPPTMCTPFG